MEKIVTVADQLKMMRKGYKQDLELVYNDLKVPVRLMSASEQGAAIANAKTKVKVVHESQRDLLESLEVMKSVLEKAALVEGTPRLSREFLDHLTDFEIEQLFEQYQTICRTVNPGFEQLSETEIVAMIRDVKKKAKSSKDFYTWQLAAIGKYFLDTILPMVNELGS